MVAGADWGRVPAGADVSWHACRHVSRPGAAPWQASRRGFLGSSLGLALLPAATVLGGCASLLEPQIGSPAIDRQWAGRFALVVEPSTRLPDGDRQSGNFELTRRGDQTGLELLSPLGNTIASARTGPRGAILQTADGKRYEDVDGEALTEQIFGWRLPVDRLPAWLDGRIAEVRRWADSPPAQPGDRAIGMPGAPGRPLEGVDRGWEVRFDQWFEDLTPPRPSRLVINYPGRLRLTLVVNRPSANLSP